MSTQFQSVAFRPLLEADITVGAFLWYEGGTNQKRWSCPAQIVSVDADRRVFRIRSLDDLGEQPAEYGFDPLDGPPSRRTMTPIDAEEARRYLRARVSASRQALEAAEREIESRRDAHRTLCEGARGILDGPDAR